MLSIALEPAPRAQRSAERPSAEILIDAVFLDKNHNPVTDLRRDEVEVWISGFRVPVDTFIAVTPETGDRSGRSIVLLLDDVTLPLALVPRAREVARRFVERMLPGDQLSIVAVNGSVTESTGERPALLRAIDRYHTQLSGVTPVDALGEHVLETITSLARQLGSAGDRRNAIVGIGSAWLFDTPIPPPSIGRDLRPEWTAAIATLASTNSTFYVIDPSGVGMRTDGGSSGFARETGGHAFVNTNDVNQAADRILREAGHYYLIGVTDPPIQRKAELRELDVRVLRRGLTVRARRGIPGTQQDRR
jgi:VWFA-related protein